MLEACACGGVDCGQADVQVNIECWEQEFAEENKSKDIASHATRLAVPSGGGTSEVLNV